MLPINLEIVLYLLYHLGDWNALIIASGRKFHHEASDDVIKCTALELLELRRDDKYEEFDSFFYFTQKI
jgi:hypothetical protein